MAATQILPASRSELHEFLKGDVLSGKFLELFDIRNEEINQAKKKNEKKKTKKKTKNKSKEKKQKRDKSPETFDNSVPNVELCGNPSVFNVYAAVRQSVLDRCMKDVTRIYHQSVSPTSDSDSDDNSDDKNKDAVIKLPKIVGLGLNGVFELVRETRQKYPELCVKALKALLDLLQGQQPESMKSEPPDVIDGLYHLLMEIATKNTSDLKLPSLACSALVSLVIALGDTGKILTAVSAMLMSPLQLSSQEITVPGILTSLQKSVQAVLLGKSQLPDWYTHGVKVTALIDKFNFNCEALSDSEPNAMSSDGHYLYILNKKGLFKIGSGYAETVKGHIYCHREDFPIGPNVWLACAGGKLFCRSDNNTRPSLSVIDKKNLEMKTSFKLDGKGPGPSALFSDGEHIGQIAAAKDDSFVVRMFNPVESPMPVVSELPLKLTRKCLDVFGMASFDPQVERHSISTGFDEDSATITSAKEFSLIRTVGGKVLYTGKAQSLGIKQGGLAPGKWAELPITKSPKIIQVATGHEGQHALMIADDGSIFFVGTPRRGEDGDTSISKVRRQPKAVKPKKLIRFESKFIVYAACNNGSSALVTKEGEVYMLGKDTTHCDNASGHVTDLKDVVVTQVALGKAHTVALTSKGQVFTFGINNKGQCGRDFNPSGSKEVSHNVTMAEEEEETEVEDIICMPGKHKWKQDHCMVCVICNECTGYGMACIHSGQKDRNPGTRCGCGSGDSGCSVCGICRSCAGEQADVEEFDEGRHLEILAKSKDIKEIIIGRNNGSPLERFFRELLDRPPRHQRNLKSPKGQKQKVEASNDPDTEYTKVVSLSPVEVTIGNGDVPATQIACGQHHTVVLLQNGDVYTFGSNQYGQLGQGDTTVRGYPVKVPLPMQAVQVAAGSHHTVVLLSNGQVYTFGNSQKCTLGRAGPEESGAKTRLWYCVPGPIPGVGARYGRRATWIGASGDQTFMRIDESLINAHILASSRVFANSSSIGLIPMGEESIAIMKCLMISRLDGNCRSLAGPDQVDLSKEVVCLDPDYDVLWSYNPTNNEIKCYNNVASEARPLKANRVGLCDLFKPEIAVPVRMGCFATRSHCALHMLGCLDTLTRAQASNLTVAEESKEKLTTTKVYSKEDFSIVNRFNTHGGGWGYSGHSIEAIRFMADTDILLGGFGLFGGRGEYYGRIKIFELGTDGGDNETDGELLAETDEVAFECAAREKYAMLFEEPISIQANTWYVAWARISGPSSDCGSTGQSVVTTEDQVVFKFKSSKKSNNGTDVNAGQIPQLLYRLPSRDSPGATRKSDNVEPAHVLSKEFSCNVYPECFEALLKLLQWSWSTFQSALIEIDGFKGDNYLAAVSDLQRLVYICRCCLRLIRIYITDIYPEGTNTQKLLTESTRLAQCIGDTQDILRSILAEEVQPTSKVRIFLSEPPGSVDFLPLEEEILLECHKTFKVCFHAFYPTGNLKWLCLCDLLSRLDPDMMNAGGYGRLLAAVMEAMCHPTIKLTSIMPINCEPQTEEILRRQSVVMDDNTNSVARLSEVHKYPVLVGHMTYRIETTGIGGSQVSFKEVLDKLLMILILPIRQELNKETPLYPSVLVANTCSVLSTIVGELAATSTGLETDFATTSRPLLVTPNRFTRTSQRAYWNTGNGSPDAISFTVDKPGIVIAGVCVYGGGGEGHYDNEYELELLDDQSEGLNDPSPSQRWNSIELVKGTYGAEDCVNDIAEIKFDRPVPIKEGVKYTVRLRNHGPRTLNGDGGIGVVKCPDGTTVTFTACSLSTNGTSHMRGQIPQLLYYSAPQEGENHQENNKSLAELQARKNAIDIVSAICRVATDVLHRAHSLNAEELKEILGKSHLFSSLLPLTLAYVGPVASQDPRGAVQVLGMIQEILPAVANINNKISPPPPNIDSTVEANGGTTSHHYAVVESDHPYKPATVSNYKVTFPDSVQWMVLEFDPQCGTAQAEDTLQLFIPAPQKNDVMTQSSSSQGDDDLKTKPSQWPVLKKFSGVENWPRYAVIIPGNEVTFSLETASDYVKDDKACFYGFKCVIVGYEWKNKIGESISQLERELVYLGGMCTASLIKKDIGLPPVSVEELDEDMDYVEEGSQLVFNSHSALLGKGFALSHPPTIMQALEGNLPFCWQSNERSFLKDFVACNPGTSGGRLARWLQPDSYLDPSQCEILYSKEDLKCSWPAVISVLTKDQYGELVHVPNLKVEVKAVPIDLGPMGDDSKKMRRLSRADEGNMNFGGHPPPCLETSYEPTVKDKKDVFHAISMMKAYENYSFEELRFAAPAVPPPSENMLVRTSNDGTYSAHWTPGSVGFYNIHVNIDGFDTGEVYKVEVKDPPQGITPPSQGDKKSQRQTKMRRFVAKYSAGLRVRTNPSLQSEQIGIVPPEGIISFIDEIHNDDGVWIRLSQESIRECCTNGHIEGWCLQYNQRLGKVLLVPIEEPKSIVDEMIKETIMRKLPEIVRAEAAKPKRGPGVYEVLKCGSFGHNIRSRPSLKATPIGMLTLGDRITAIEDSTNQDGTWIKLDQESIDQYCQNKNSEAWSLVSGREGISYLQHENDISEEGIMNESDPFAFSMSTGSKGFNFGQQITPMTPASFFGATPVASGPFGRSASLPGAVFAFGQGSSVFPSFGQHPTHPPPTFGLGTGTNYDTYTPPSMNKDPHMKRNQSMPATSSMTSKSTPIPFSSKPSSTSKQDSSPSRSKSPASGSPKSSRLEGNSIPPELQGVSVRELVKALGESRANANGPTPVPSPPGTPKKSGSRSSSPHLAADLQGSPRTGSPIRSISPKLQKSDSKSRVSESSSQASLKDEMFSTPPDSPILPRQAQLQREASFDKSSQSPPGSPSTRRRHSSMGVLGSTQQDSSLVGLQPSHARKSSLGSPRHTSPARTSGSPQRRGSSPHLSASPSPRSGSPAQGQSSGELYFSIGSSSPKEESLRMSPKSNRKDRGRQLRSKRERAASPSTRDVTQLGRARSSSASMIHEKVKDPVKEAFSPSVAECLRAVFAAFLWHEGIVHDAMACATFLKFHPNLQKEMSKFAKIKKQEKIRTRHATESSKELAKKKENMNINEARVRFNLEPQFLRSDSEKSDKSDKSDKSEKSDKGEITPVADVKSKKPVERHKSESNVSFFNESQEFKNKDSQLPPTLHHLVYFWEELSLSILKVINQGVIYPSPAVALKAKKGEKKEKEKDKEKKGKKKKEAKPEWRANAVAVGDAIAGVFGGGAMGGALGGDKSETLCELCGGTFPHPVTYHMRQTHAGCGRHAGGLGYNSSGSYCGGWAGNCGEGGFGGSSWYLICERCRDKYLKEKRQSQKDKDKSKKMKKKSNLSRHQAILSPQEPHFILRNNAMFLLDLASASGFSLPPQKNKKHQRMSRSDILLPSVYEEYGSELNPFPATPFTYLILQGAQNSDSAFADDFYIDADERVFVRSGSLSITQRSAVPTRPRLPTEPRHSPLARSGSLGQDLRPSMCHMSPPSPKDLTSPANSTSSDTPIAKSAGTSPDSELEAAYKKSAFQRSISEIVSDNDDGQGNERSRYFSSRRRNNSGGVGDGGMSLLKHPSAAMTKLITSVDKGGASSVEGGEQALQRPVLSFIIQRHDLEALQLAMRQALRKAACRVFAFQALNWLLRSVTQVVCIHDLLWFFVAALAPPSEDIDEEEEEDKDKEKDKEKEKEKDKEKEKQAKKHLSKKDQEDSPLCEHPLTDINIAGKAVEPLPETFHTLLQTITDVMLHLPWGTAVQQMAVRCFCLKFRQTDHQFLHESHVFSNISRILSKSDEEKEDIGDSQTSYKIWNLKDLTPTADIQASSRQAMIASLTDNSTETFWESGDEDRNKVKSITITCIIKTFPKFIYVHIDNSRDLGNKVGSITFNAGKGTDDLTKISQIDVEPRHVGWISCPLQDPGVRCIQIELKGPDHSLRIRQVKILGEMEGENVYLTVRKGAIDMQQDYCEAETLRVFRILTSQVFGKLILENEPDDKKAAVKPERGESFDSVDGDHNLKEHMVGILFSRSKLSHLQKQVCSHIVQGIRKEALKVREEWETAVQNNIEQINENSDEDVYCFELLSMVLALSGSGVGRAYLAQQYPLLQDLFSLLHTGSPRVQRQVISVLRRVLPDVKPQTLANILSVTALPPAEYSIVSLASRNEGDVTFDPNKPCILDVLLSCISKALTVQVKVKTSGLNKGVTSTTMTESLANQPSSKSSGPRWWLRGKMTAALATNIITLIQDMAAGRLSENWATVTKAAIAEAILALTKLEENTRLPQFCLKTPTLWLALSSLCVLDQDHVERLTSGQWISSPNGQHGQPRPTCDNHDDGETQAIILCNDCGNLCADCDRFLHLPKTKRSHQRQVFKEEEEAIKVDLHEGCGRTKLFWLMALADSKTLKAMVEFREGKSSTATSGPGTCRFCGATSNTGVLAIGNVCADPECQEHAKNACTKVLPCGHPCGGLHNEDPCLPCLHRCGNKDQEKLKQDADDMCMICFTEALAAAPAIMLKCNHVFHYHCSKNILEKKWAGPRITFGFSLCPICKSQIDHPVLKDILRPIRDLYEDVRRKALMRLEYEGLHMAEAITTVGARFYQDPAGFAMDRYAYYVCFKCKKAYYGGEVRCDDMIGASEDYDPRELVCGGCSDVSRAQMCPKHGTDFLEHKCRYCCSVAIFFCFGTTHFCNACHDDFQRVTNIPKTELPHCPAGPRGKQMEGDECPLHVQHPPTGEEFALGCGVCRNAHTF